MTYASHVVSTVSVLHTLPFYLLQPNSRGNKRLDYNYIILPVGLPPSESDMEMFHSHRMLSTSLVCSV
jgi:hypothetical protein